MRVNKVYVNVRKYYGYKPITTVWRNCCHTQGTSSEVCKGEKLRTV